MTARYRALMAILAVVLLGVPAAGCTDSGSPGGDDPGSSATSATAEPGAPTEGYDGWVVATLVDKTPVFGIPLEGDNSQFVLLDDAFFIAQGEDGDVNLLRRFGNEIHKPLPQVAVPWSSILYQESLSTDSEALAAIIQFEQSNPATAVVDPVLGSGAVHAVFLKTGDVFFGTVEVDGTALRVADAHFLRFKDGTDSGEELTSLDDVELVPQTQVPAGPTGEMLIPLQSVLYVQRLAEDSPIVEALGE